MTFQDARLKLLAYVRNEVRNGELTERGLARLVGISQPHAHNVLKGARTLSPQIFDLVLKYLHLSLLDLASTEEIEAQMERRRARAKMADVVFLANPIGPGHPWIDAINRRKTFPVPVGDVVSPELVMAKFDFDPTMEATLGTHDIALLDTSRERRSAISTDGLYVVERRGEAVIRYVRSGARWPYLVTDSNRDTPTSWEPLTLSAERFQDAVKARVVWLGRERDRESFTHPGRFLYDPISS
ncbi:MAG TPA: hypothetical protein VFW44_17060 [Bryobacteraceae bacterium]|nr:hypothetical protein [Bryobacteraceae bacterium]